MISWINEESKKDCLLLTFSEFKQEPCRRYVSCFLLHCPLEICRKRVRSSFECCNLKRKLRTNLGKLNEQTWTLSYVSQTRQRSSEKKKKKKKKTCCACWQQVRIWGIKLVLPVTVIWDLGFILNWDMLRNVLTFWFVEWVLCNDERNAPKFSPADQTRSDTWHSPVSWNQKGKTCPVLKPMSPCLFS